ncbi:glycosyltransferase [Phreatobacter aquaticus]|uniref:Glycosyltransferase n=1 Tax=Phreatobacter aquaticus TaxID=2570229 RepID=A0A4D7QLP9_9HYPH|nr:glycosyltransferase [Phreatobacter aquaticus]QCK88528.1 glycosyltransferase [Phreatobacter aquaticus]
MLPTSPPSRLTVLVSDARALCGVEAFARRLAETAGDRAMTHVLGWNLPALGTALNDRDVLVINLPVVAWKKRLAEPVAAAATARLAGRAVVLVLHEWADLDWKRRATYAPLVPLATEILFSSPEVARQFAGSPVARLATCRRGIVPIPPNLVRPALLPPTALASRLAGERAKGRLVLGHFGSIYPKKQSAIVLEVAARLKARGQPVFVAFIGSFVKGIDQVEEDFRARVAALGLEDDVLVTGYVETDAEIFRLFEEVDVFVYAFAEGLTARRGSVLACAMSGRPVVVNAPAEADAFAHHPTYRRLIDEGRLRLVPTDADADALTDAIMAAAAAPAPAVASGVDITAAWNDVLASVDAVLARPAKS